MDTALHLVVARLRADVTDEARGALVALAAGLRAAPQAESALVGLSPDLLVAATWLHGRDALDAFAATPQHMGFVMEGLARTTQGMWTAAVTCDEPCPLTADYVWAFAVPAVEGAYEWQVRDLLAAIDALPGRAVLGPTIEYRDRFRAAGLVALASHELDRFSADLEVARGRWGALGDALETALAPLVRP